jgi:hypothetical protein
MLRPLMLKASNLIEAVMNILATGKAAPSQKRLCDVTAERWFETLRSELGVLPR